jgi:glucose/arabinose dehydrogenase
MNRSFTPKYKQSCVAVALALAGFAAASTAWAQTGVNARCTDETVFFNPGNGEDIIVPPGYRVSVFKKGLNFPTNIAFRRSGKSFEVFVTEAGTSLPGFCNAAEGYPSPDAANPFLPQVRVLDSSGNTLRVLGRSPTVAGRENPAFLHAPTIGIAFENDFNGGRLFVTDSLQGVRGAQGPKNSSRVLQVNPQSGTVTQLITGLPTGDHPTEQITVKDGWLYWSQGSVTNNGVVGHDNTGPAGVGGPPDTAVQFQHEIPCQDVVLSGNNSDSGDGHVTGGWLPHGVPGTAGQVVRAFSGATQPGMCSGAILRAKISNPQRTVEPFSWGYRNPFGLRFAPNDHPLKGALLVSENGEDERGARPTNQAPDRLQVTNGGLDFHGWPDRFGFLNSTQAIFTPIGGPADDCVACAAGKPVLPLMQFPPQPPVAPLGIEPTDVAVVGLDFVPKTFAGGGQPGDKVDKGDALVTREGDFGFSPRNGTPIEGHDIERVSWTKTGISLERFAHNCKLADQHTLANGRKLCAKAAEQAFIDLIRGINRPVDGKFGPDGAFYLVDFGAVRDFGRSTNDERPAPATATSPGNSSFINPDHAPLVQIPGTGVIWKFERIDDDRHGHGHDDD